MLRRGELKATSEIIAKYKTPQGKNTEETPIAKDLADWFFCFMAAAIIFWENVFKNFKCGPYFLAQKMTKENTKTMAKKYQNQVPSLWSNKFNVSLPKKERIVAIVMYPSRRPIWYFQLLLEPCAASKLKGPHIPTQWRLLVRPKPKNTRGISHGDIVVRLLKRSDKGKLFAIKRVGVFWTFRKIQCCFEWPLLQNRRGKLEKNICRALSTRL